MNLFEDFIRSAVKQVGRDGGRVISNRIYKGAHATPISVQSRSGSSKRTVEEVPIDAVPREELKENGYKTELIFTRGFGSYLFFYIGAMIPMIGFFNGIRALIRGVKAIRQNYLSFYTIGQAPVYKSDRRYKSGQRIDGYVNVRKYHKSVFSLTPNENRILNFKGTIWLIMGILIILYNASFIYSYNLPETVVNDQMQTTAALNLREGESITAEIIKTIPLDNTVTILENTGEWSMVIHEGDTGYVSTQFLE